MNSQMEQLEAIIQAVAQGQDLSQFDPQALNAAKQYVVGKSNELSRMVNSTELPPNVTREMARNELTMYQGFADKLAEDDPEFASMMDVALIGAGVYATAKYGPIALTKAKTMGESAFGFAKTQVANVKNYTSGAGAGMAGRAAAGVGAAADYASRGAEYASQSPRAQRAAAGVGRATQYAKDFGQGVGGQFQRPYPNQGPPVGLNRRIGMGVGNYSQYNPGYAAGSRVGSFGKNVGQKTFGFGKSVLGGIAGLARKALFRV